MSFIFILSLTAIVIGHIVSEAASFAVRDAKVKSEDYTYEKRSDLNEWLMKTFMRKAWRVRVTRDIAWQEHTLDLTLRHFKDKCEFCKKVPKRSVVPYWDSPLYNSSPRLPDPGREPIGWRANHTGELSYNEARHFVDYFEAALDQRETLREIEQSIKCLDCERPGIHTHMWELDSEGKRGKVLA